MPKGVEVFVDEGFAEITVPDKALRGRLRDLADLAALPVLRKSDLVELQARHAPFGGLPALLALPLARSPPRQARHGRILVGFLAYLFATMLMLLGADWLAVGKVPVAAGLWWLLLPLLGLSLWLYWRDGSLGRQRRHAGAKA